MASQWNPQLTLGGASWAGNAPVVTTKQLLSSSTGLYTYTSTTSNVLQSEISSIISGGTTSQWANYGAISTVDSSGHNITNAASVAATSFSGSLTGNVTGNLTGNVNGNVVSIAASNNLNESASNALSVTIDRRY
jgi:hypothetical protein